MTKFPIFCTFNIINLSGGVLPEFLTHKLPVNMAEGCIIWGWGCWLPLSSFALAFSPFQTLHIRSYLYSVTVCQFVCFLIELIWFLIAQLSKWNLRLSDKQGVFKKSFIKAMYKQFMNHGLIKPQLGVLSKWRWARKLRLLVGTDLRFQSKFCN